MAKSKVSQIPEKIDRLGVLQEQLEQARNAFAEKFAEVTQECETISSELEKYVAERIPLAKKPNITKEEADILNTAVASLLDDLNGELFKMPVSVRNNKIMDPALVRKALGQKRFNDLAQVSITDLGKVLGKEEIDRIITGFKPTLIFGKTVRK